QRGVPTMTIAPAAARHARQVTNDELVARYVAGEALVELAGAAGTSVSGLQERLRRTERRPAGGRSGPGR
ncbi:MAG TPA: hypothetical protein VG184_03700, partial [Acidimicrobiales bacterium]|nr:hypothetical protein [Acidimicrobiales bacterium]